MSDRMPDDLAEWSALYRSVRKAPDALKASVQAQLHDEPPAAAANDAPLRWGLGLALGGLLGAAALLALTCGLDAIRSPRAATADTPDIAPMQEVPAPDSALEPASPPRASVPAAAPTPVEPTPEPPATEPRSSRPSAPAKPAAAIPPAKSDLESLRALRAAERKLRTDPAGALKLLDQHATDYPRSNLFLEREALWIRAACRSGGAPGLPARRASFSRRADIATYRAAVERDCSPDPKKVSDQ